jgi:hypothetical protein
MQEENSNPNTESDLKLVPENANAECPGTQSTNAGKEAGCEGCPNQQICASGAL